MRAASADWLEKMFALYAMIITALLLKPDYDNLEANEEQGLQLRAVHVDAVGERHLLESASEQRGKNAGELLDERGCVRGPLSSYWKERRRRGQSSKFQIERFASWIPNEHLQGAC
jgi:hypothetical protein